MFLLYLEISCIEELCHLRYEKCRKDSDCCTKYCRIVGEEYERFCFDRNDDRQLFTESYKKGIQAKTVF